MTITGMSGNGTPKSLSISIIIAVTVFVVAIGIVTGLSLNNSNEPQRPEVLFFSQPTSPNSTPPSSTSSTSTNKTTTTTTTTSESSKTSSSTSSTSSTSASSSSSTPSTMSSSSMTTSSEPTSVPEGQDFGTGRSDLDSLGFVGSSACCDNGDRAFAVIAAEQGTKAAACETRSDEKYHRSDTPQGSGSMDIIVDKGDRVVAQNGPYKYQMSPSEVLVTKDNKVVKKYAAEAWGTV